MLQKHKYIKGFVDPLSLVAVGFLVLTIFIGTAVTKNKNISLNPNKEAACLEPCVSNSDCGSGYYCYKPATGCPECKKTATINTTNTATTITTTKDEEKEEETIKISSKFVRCCPKDNSASAINTCTGASESACKINIKVCDPLYGTNTNTQCSQPKPSSVVDSNNCLEPCVSNSDCGSGYYCYKPATGCPECKKATVASPSPTSKPTASPTYCNASLISTSGCGEGGCLSNQVKQTWKTVTCEAKELCVDSSVCNKTASPSPTPSTKMCTVRNCSENYCKTTTEVVSSSKACPFSNCVEDGDCKTKTSTNSSSTPVANFTPTNPATVCQKEFGECSTNSNCCPDLLCTQGKCLEETPTLIYYSQRDPQWQDAYFTCPDGTRVPFSSVGCGQTVTAMILSSYIDDSFTPDTVKKDYFSHSSYCSGSGISAVNDVLVDNGLSVKKVTSLKALKSALGQGEVAIVDIKFWNGTSYTTHHSLATGVDENGKIIFMDPWFGPNTTLEGVNYEIIGSEIVEEPTI